MTLSSKSTDPLVEILSVALDWFTFRRIGDGDYPLVWMRVAFNTSVKWHRLWEQQNEKCFMEREG